MMQCSLGTIWQLTAYRVNIACVCVWNMQGGHPYGSDYTPSSSGMANASIWHCRTCLRCQLLQTNLWSGDDKVPNCSFKLARLGRNSHSIDHGQLSRVPCQPPLNSALDSHVPIGGSVYFASKWLALHWCSVSKGGLVSIGCQVCVALGFLLNKTSKSS